MNVWYEALSVLADFRAPTYWRMANGAQFWWTVDSTQLGPDRFTSQPFTYAEIVSLTVVNGIPSGRETCSCDLLALGARLQAIEGLHIEELTDISCPPAIPPNKALFLKSRG